MSDNVNDTAITGMRTFTILQSINEWDRWNKELFLVADDCHIWPNIRRNDRQPWRPEPTGNNALQWKLYERQDQGQLKFRNWIASHVSRSIYSAILDLFDGNPAAWYDRIYSYLDITDNRARETPSLT